MGEFASPFYTINAFILQLIMEKMDMENLILFSRISRGQKSNLSCL